MQNNVLFLSISILTTCLLSCGEHSKEQETTKDNMVITEVNSPAGNGSSLPYLFSDSERLLMSYVEKAGDTSSTLYYAELADGEWQQPKEILKGNDWFVNWADFPVIAENKGNLFTHVLRKSSPDTYSYDVKMNLLTNSSKQWKTDVPLHTDGTNTEHGFVTALPYKEGFFLTWLDGRNTGEDTEGNRGAMTIRAAEVAASGEVSNETQLDVSTCDCCQTTAAVTSNGSVVLYRDRSSEEVRDISIVRQVDGKWTEPKSIYNDNWNIKGCPVNGPKAAALGNNLAVAWFTAAEGKPMVKLIFSEDGGATFKEPIRIDQNQALGRVDVLLLDTKTAIVSWMEMSGKQAVIKAVKVGMDGLKSESIAIARLDASRSTGFPQMELLKDNVHFAWTAVNDATTTIATVFVPVTQF